MSRLVARPMLASMFVVGPLNALKNADGTATNIEASIGRATSLLTVMCPCYPIGGGKTPRSPFIGG